MLYLEVWCWNSVQAADIRFDFINRWAALQTVGPQYTTLQGSDTAAMLELTHVPINHLEPEGSEEHLTVVCIMINGLDINHGGRKAPQDKHMYCVCEHILQSHESITALHSVKH